MYVVRKRSVRRFQYVCMGALCNLAVFPPIHLELVQRKQRSSGIHQKHMQQPPIEIRVSWGGTACGRRWMRAVDDGHLQLPTTPWIAVHVLGYSCREGIYPRRHFLPSTAQTTNDETAALTPCFWYCRQICPYLSNKPCRKPNGRRLLSCVTTTRPNSVPTRSRKRTLKDYGDTRRRYQPHYGVQGFTRPCRVRAMCAYKCR